MRRWFIWPGANAFIRYSRWIAGIFRSIVRRGPAHFVFSRNAWAAGLLFAEIAVHEPDQPVQLIGDLGQAHVDVVHALLVEREALGLHLLHFRLAALNLSHDNQRVLEPIDLLLEVHNLNNSMLKSK